MAALAAICVYNDNAWALAAVPLVRILGKSQADVPRWRWAFLGYYVAHLAVLAVLTGMVD